MRDEMQEWKRAQYSASHQHEKWLKREPGLCNESQGLQRGSAWKDSSFCNRVEFNIHILATKSRHGNTQCSTMLLEETGLRLPWKTPLPLAKKACLAFLMFSSTHLVHNRLADHNAPKHLAEVVRGNCKSPVWM